MITFSNIISLSSCKVEEDEVGGTCGMNGEKTNVYNLPVGKPEGK
jgi:hypothetical protein